MHDFEPGNHVFRGHAGHNVKHNVEHKTSPFEKISSLYFTWSFTACGVVVHHIPGICPTSPKGYIVSTCNTLKIQKVRENLKNLSTMIQKRAYAWKTH